jgi:proteasome maturation protein
MRIVPESSHKSLHSHLSTGTVGAPSAPGLHDTLRTGLGPAASTSSAQAIDSTHPLESRLALWSQTQHDLKLTGLRRTFGIAEPIRREMELKITRDGEWRPLVLGASAMRAGVHEDILMNRDASVGWEDVFTGEEGRSVRGVHEEMEGRVRMGQL